MPLWKLKPIELNNNTWTASTYRAAVVVRAEDESKARLRAAIAYKRATQCQPGEIQPNSPWGQSEFVSAMQVPATDDYAEDGDQGIVHPAAAVVAAHPGYNKT